MVPDQALRPARQDPLVDQVRGLHLRVAGQVLLVRPAPGGVEEGEVGEHVQDRGRAHQQLDGALHVGLPGQVLVIGGGPERRPQVHGRADGAEPQLQPVGGDGEDVGGEEPRVLGGVHVVDLAGGVGPSGLRGRGLHLDNDQRQPVDPVHEVEPAGGLAGDGDGHLVRHDQRVSGRVLEVDDLQGVPHAVGVPELLLPAQQAQHLLVGPHQPAFDGVDRGDDLLDHRVHVEPADHPGVEPDDGIAQVADEHRLRRLARQRPARCEAPAHREGPLDHQVLELTLPDALCHGSDLQLGGLDVDGAVQQAREQLRPGLLGDCRPRRGSLRPARPSHPVPPPPAPARAGTGREAPPDRSWSGFSRLRRCTVPTTLLCISAHSRGVRQTCFIHPGADVTGKGEGRELVTRHEAVELCRYYRDRPLPGSQLPHHHLVLPKHVHRGVLVVCPVERRPCPRALCRR